jgi:type II secretory pathway predicted ATPase ExeA
MSLPEKIQWLQASLIENLQQGKTIVLVIDDAHNISDETLSELLSFSSAQKNEEHFLQIFLIGLPELEEKLHATMSAPSAHKVAYYRLWPLESSEVPKFIAQQLRAAGYQGNTIFTPSAVERIAEYTKGSLRALSLLCDASLVIAYMQSSRQVTADIVDEAAQQHFLIPQSQP